MPRSARVRTTVAAGVGGLAAVGGACLAYAGLYEVNAFRLREASVPILPAGSTPIRVLHISDMHMVPQARARQRWIAGLADLEPDLVVNTGDNISHPDAVPYVLTSLGRLLEVPGVYVWGSNDYYAPTFKNPVKYLTEPSRTGTQHRHVLPWRDLDEAFKATGWIDLTHTRQILVIKGLRLALRGTDDGHLGRDRYATVAGPIDRTECDVAIGVTHAPYRRIIDPMTWDGHDLLLAGHTHGGQVCVPGFGALVTNCDLDTARVKGLSTNRTASRTSWLHVSGGLGTSPYAPIRFACPPEATLLNLTPAP